MLIKKARNESFLIPKIKPTTQIKMNRITLLALLALGAFFANLGFAQEAKTLEATGKFIKNDKGAVVFTDDADKKRYYGFNDGVKKKVGDMLNKKVNLKAKVKKKEGAKITLMTFVVSIKEAK
tara:strand:- start:696 stop:1064 length:369 start_codon:yes stop_codon:yes gene_type:complete